MEREEGLRRRAERQLDLPDGCLQPAARVELCERRHALIEGCTALLCCEEDTVTLRTARGAVRVRGSGLQLQGLARQEAIVTGEVLSVEFL